MSETSAGDSELPKSATPQLWVRDTAGNPSPVSSTAEVSEALFLEFEQQVATCLGNAERLKRCQSLEYFPAARTERRRAVRLVCKQYHFDTLSVPAKPTLGALKDYVLQGLGAVDTPDVLLRNMADVIYNAALQGDVKFFQNMGPAFRRHERSKRDTSLAWCIVLYWFAGLLWLMDAEAGHRALISYLKEVGNARREIVTLDAYRKACSRLGLKGYKAFATQAPVLAYHPKQRAYEYRKGLDTFGTKVVELLRGSLMSDDISNDIPTSSQHNQKPTRGRVITSPNRHYK
jgi:hypothetical protein